MHVVLVEHQQGGQRYLFRCDGLERFVKPGETVICDTVRGQTTGIAVTRPIHVESSAGSLASLFKQCGAYLPIKRILGIVRPRELTEDEKEQIAKEWLRKKYFPDDLPF